MRPLTLVGVALVGLGIAIGQPLILGIGLVSAVLGVFGWSLETRKNAIATDPSELGAEARWLLRPIRELMTGLETVSKDKSASPEVRVIAQESVVEAEAIYAKAVELAKVRDALKKSIKGQGEAETNLNRLTRQLESATNESERSSLESAIQSRTLEIKAYDDAKSKISEIDSRLNQATATLSEIKARLATGSIHSGTLSDEHDEFNDMVTRLKSLGQSFDEAQQMNEVQP